MRKKALIAMSGGVDSTVAAALTLEQDIQCIGITLRLYRKESGCCSIADENEIKNIAAGLGIEHYFLDFSGEFDKHVIRRFVESYEQGATPNPCIDCNRRIKFNPALFREKLPVQDDFDLFITGHYARVKQDPISGRYNLQKALDEKKDQSYVLYCLSQQQLQNLSLPLGELKKNNVRKIAEERKFTNAAKGESQDICFVPAGDYGDFIENYTGKKYPSGDILDLEGNVIGRHRGIIRYTIGQRRGLGVAANVPVYVKAKSAADNTVTLGPDTSLYGKSLIAKDINLIACGNINKPMRVMVKTRYLQDAQSAIAEQTGEDSLNIEFDKAQRAIAPGQAAVMYDGDIVIGGGTISIAY